MKYEDAFFLLPLAVFVILGVALLFLFSIGADGGFRGMALPLVISTTHRGLEACSAFSGPFLSALLPE